ncbi:ABC transporter permease [Candidatus Bathyarchaeota archaeon]|nr:ABC transporter permease [Candidatus Bathyarchaeota archaeon]
MEMLDDILKAFQLIIQSDQRILEITLRSLFVSGVATFFAILWGIPIALFLGTRNFRGKFVIKSFFNTMIGIPTVALGLILFLIFSKAGPLGLFRLLYSPGAIIIGETILILPIIVSFATTAIESVDPEIMNLAKTLGASEDQALFAVLKEALDGIVVAGIASFNRAIAELGIALIVGGNIAGWTEVLTTAISNETAKGNIELSIALGIILLLLVFGITLASLAINTLRRRRK